MLMLAFHVAASSAFSSPIFQETATLQRTAPSKTVGVEIELPDFDEMFRRIQAVSPLARLAVQGGGSGEGGGFGAVDDTSEYFQNNIITRDVSVCINLFQNMNFLHSCFVFQLLCFAFTTTHSSSGWAKVEEPKEEQKRYCFSN